MFLASVFENIRCYVVVAPFGHGLLRKHRVKRSFKVTAISNKLADIPPDEYSWMKCGQKPFKGSPYPRGYYKCSSIRGFPDKALPSLFKKFAVDTSMDADIAIKNAKKASSKDMELCLSSTEHVKLQSRAGNRISTDTGNKVGANSQLRKYCRSCLQLPFHLQCQPVPNGSILRPSPIIYLCINRSSSSFQSEFPHGVEYLRALLPNCEELRITG